MLPLTNKDKSIVNIGGNQQTCDNVIIGYYCLHDDGFALDENLSKSNGKLSL